MDTQAFNPDTVNLITINLQDHYLTGFPILKELIQNADDARARRLIFGQHRGFPQADHPLLQGAALWFFNDGQFAATDKPNLRAFGIDTKAGDAQTTGKFGLGMKSVFHLCEAFFYLAWDGHEQHREALNPWKNADGNLHPEWDGRNDGDWQWLETLGWDVAGSNSQHWFLLWIPLRRRAHLRRDNGTTTGAIVEHFPGDDPQQALEFLTDANLGADLAELLPLLRHLETIQYRDQDNPIRLQVQAKARLLGELASNQTLTQVDNRATTLGQVVDETNTAWLEFTGVTHGTSAAWPQQLKACEAWPKVRYRDKYGHLQTKPDHQRPEAAVIFCTHRQRIRAGKLHWAVVLPLADGELLLSSDAGIVVLLHGEFFIDAGRREIFGQQRLHEPPESNLRDGASLRLAWNQRLAQDVVAPAILPALEHHVQELALDHHHISQLTQAIGTCDWFKLFKQHICARDSWVFVLTQDGSHWRCVSGDDRQRLRPMPVSKSELARPWLVFPRLAEMDVLLYDSNAPILSDRHHTWQEAELCELLAEVNGLFSDVSSMDYLENFLADTASAFVQTERVETQLIRCLRDAMAATDRANRQQFAEKARRLLRRITSLRRFDLTAFLPESTLRRLWRSSSDILLIPKELETKDANAQADEKTLRAWFDQLDQEIRMAEGSAFVPLLSAAQGLLPCDPKERGQFLRAHPALRIIALRDPVTGKDAPAATADIQQARENGHLFGFAQGIQSEQLGFTPLLARTLPETTIRLVRADLFRQLFPDYQSLPRADDPVAILIAVGRSPGLLAGFNERCALLQKANDPGTNLMARRGLRYLLHGSSAHREDDQATLWVPKSGEHSAWLKLWSQLHEDVAWSQIDAGLAGTLATNRYQQAGIEVIDPRTLLGLLKQAPHRITDPGCFSLGERECILAALADDDLWRRLPLHTDLLGQPVSAEKPLVFLALRSTVPSDTLISRATLIARSNNREIANQQKEWLKPLDDVARIELALDAEDSAIYCQTILDALMAINLADHPDLRWQLREHRAWLPTQEAGSVKPEDVIDLSAFGLSDDLWRLTAEHQKRTGQSIYTVPERLANLVTKHPAWTRTVQALCSSEDSGVERLGLLLSDLNDYRIGAWPHAPESEQLDLLAGCSELPAFSLLAKLQAQSRIGANAAWNALRDGLAKPLSPERLAAVLAWLSQTTSNWTPRKKSFDLYLGWLAACSNFKTTYLPALKLAACDCRWQSPAKLCAGAHGIDSAWQLDQRQADQLAGLICRCDRHPEQTDQAATSSLSADFRSMLEAAPSILADYFRAFDQAGFPSGMTGAILALLGSSVRPLAEQYLRPHSYQWFLGQLNWIDPGRTAERVRWMGNQTAATALDLIRAGVRVVGDQQISALNLLGSPIQVPLETEPRTLLAGPFLWKGGYAVEIALRRIDLQRLAPAQGCELLRATAEKLYAGLYKQKQPDFSKLWRDLDNVQQLEIGAARQHILSHLAFYLRQLPIKNEELKKALNRVQEAESRQVEASLHNQPTAHSSTSHHAKPEQLADLIQNNETVGQAILSAYREKLDQLQYQKSSIPFELFQNADDAASELGELEAFPHGDRDIPQDARRFVIDIHQDSIRFMHWGRPVNARGPAGFPSADRGFGLDLQKMLVLSASDKPLAEQVTGQFGLGFKSVFLACDQPRLLSGRLALNIVSGILPQPRDDLHNLRKVLDHYALPNSRLSGTLIELPAVDPNIQPQILDRFERLAGLLSVFAIAIREISLVRNVSSQRFCWEPESPLPTVPAIEFGKLRLRDKSWGAETNAICIRTRYGAVLLAIGPGGWRPLPNNTPNIWVTAPLCEPTGFGFACSAAFDLDTGRVNLAINRQKNIGLAQQLGAEVGDALTALLMASQANWPDFRKILGLDPNQAAHDFWLRFWQCLTQSCLEQTDASTHQVLRELALALLHRLSANSKAIPNGLPGDLQAMIDRADARFRLSKKLCDERIVAVLANWESFARKYPRQQIVSEEIGKILKAGHQSGHMADPIPLGLSALLALPEGLRLAPPDVQALGAIHELTEEDREWQDPKGKVQPLLEKLKFRTLNNKWQPATDLLAGVGANKDSDEPLRYDLAPDSRRLHPEYWTGMADRQGLAFFFLARGFLKADTNELAQWILSAQTETEKRAALRYIVDGKLGGDVADEVRGQRWLEHVLQQTDLLNAFEAAEITKLKRLLATDTEIDDLGTESPETLLPPPTHSLSLKEALHRIFDWWDKEGKSHEQQHREKLYPLGKLNFSVDDGSRKIDRDFWLTLLALGAFQSMGRTHEIQHRGFIEHCQHKNWWQIFANKDPKLCPDQWMDVIEQYADGQHDDEQWSQWIAYFPRLYRFRRWMDDYVDLFLSIDRFNQDFTLDQLLTPKANPHFQGGGIEAPPLIRTLRVGGPLIIRELLYQKIITNPLAIPHAYAPIQRIKDWFGQFDEIVETSNDIYDLLVKHLDEQRATFNGAYDIPLRLISLDQTLELRILTQ
ncbi:hypothetical protein Thiowin_03011 [Thiorhodovibrio winogradskyi]|uniref:Sacsin/Nov domain-containing protein n=1 Tax=Thiorhodovibrio winogradskyi TaxID=77007 RepID=A0ABZ0SAA7_9GAMM|nr:hypothetical protein [Thiorhodovibrio winogradskyi]